MIFNVSVFIIFILFLGRGYEVDSETYNYFLQVLEIWQKNEFSSDEERGKKYKIHFLQGFMFNY